MGKLIIIVPVVFILFGVLEIIKTIILKKKCTEYVDATVVDIAVSHDSEGSSTYHPVFGYTFDGVDYRRKSGFYSSFLRFNVGDQVELYIDPEKPKRFYCPKETIHRIILCLVFIAVGVFVMFIFRNMRV